MTDSPVELSYTDVGTGVPILLIHGWTCDSNDWSFQIPEFAQNHRVIAPDLRGHGRSPVTAKGYDPETFAADIVQVLSRIDCPPVVAIGHSMGALVAAALAIEHPERVLATIVVDSAYGQLDAFKQVSESLLETTGTEEGRTQLAQLFGEVEPTAPPWLRLWHQRRAMLCPPHVVSECLIGEYFIPNQFGLRHQSEDYLAKRQSPVLGFYRNPEMAAWETSILPQDDLSRVVSWEGSGHWLHEERPVEFNHLALEWVDGLR